MNRVRLKTVQPTTLFQSRGEFSTLMIAPNNTLDEHIALRSTGGCEFLNN